MIIVRDVVRVEGPDAASFLQGQVSQDVDGLAIGASAWALVLQPQGKVDAWVRVTRVAADSFDLDVDAGFGEAVVARLERFKLRVKATLTAIEPRAFEAGGVAPDGSETPLRLVAVDADPDPDWRAAWDAYRVENGIPAMGRELTEDTIPEEAGLVDVSVSFTKGCYTGQELVARIDSRGRNVPRRLRRLELVDGDEFSDGDEITIDTGGDGGDGRKVVGTVTTAAGAIALGYVGRAVEVPATVKTTAGVARIVALPPLR